MITAYRNKAHPEAGVDRRSSRRFRLELPVVVVRYGNTQVRNDGHTLSVSSRGVLMTVNTPVTVGESVEYFLLLTAGQGSRAPVVLHCVGTVVRTGPDMVAATIERYELQRHSTGDGHPWQTGESR